VLTKALCIRDPSDPSGPCLPCKKSSYFSQRLRTYFASPMSSFRAPKAAQQSWLENWIPSENFQILPTPPPPPRPEHGLDLQSLSDILPCPVGNDVGLCRKLRDFPSFTPQPHDQDGNIVREPENEFRENRLHWRSQKCNRRCWYANGSCYNCQHFVAISKFQRTVQEKSLIFVWIILFRSRL
jgi:hypothetical protein